MEFITQDNDCYVIRLSNGEYLAKNDFTYEGVPIQHATFYN